MDTLLWDAIQSLRSCRNQQNVDNNSMCNASVTDSNQNAYREFSGHIVGKPQSSASGSEEWKGPTSTSYDYYNQESEAEDPDGVPLLIEDVDPELARKRKELHEIESRIKQKKVSIALKTVENVVNYPTEAPSTNGESDECEGPTLKERVHAILQHRRPNSSLSKVRTPPKGILKSCSHRKLQGDHPLKLRVKALLKQRHNDPFIFSTYGQVPDITPPPPAQREPSAEKEANSNDLGFQRFLSILNKGVDMEMLSKIVTAEGEDLPVEAPDNQPPALEDKLEPLRSKKQGGDPPLRSESQGSSSGASLPRLRCTSSGERKTSLHSQERSPSERFSLLSDEEKRNDRGDHCLPSSGASLPSHSPTSRAERKINLHSRERSLSQKLSLPKDEVKNNQADRCFASTSRSRSPPALKKKKRKRKMEEKEKEKTPKVDDHCEQLKNILRTLGLSLEVEEMSKLTDRTQERLYGKKRTESRERQDSQQRGPHQHYRNSSSSSSSSGSKSRSFSPSPSRSQLSRSRDSKERRTSERSRSRDRHRDELLDHDSKQDGEKALRYGDRDGEHIKDTLTHENSDSHQPLSTYSAHCPSGYPTYTDYDFPQYSQFEDYQNTFNGVTNSYWMDPQNAHSAHLYSSMYSHQQDPLNHFSDHSATPQKVLKCQLSAQDATFFANPDLSQSEGQVGSASGSRYLVSPQRTAQRTAQQTAQRVAQWAAQWTARHTAQQAAQWAAQRQAQWTAQRTAQWMPQPMPQPSCANAPPEAIYLKRKKSKKSKKTPKWMPPRVIEKTDKPVIKRELLEVNVTEEKKEKALRVDKEDSETGQSEEVKQPPTEEETKRNLRKMLAAFNQKPKPNFIQPPNIVSCETE
ncbi:uncharacterized protein LOC141787110 [Halichoeres trimaculatus]|uniref:uncharacterized protein LOC141787110 n=1 Tax=Halichoeres trimaculatus TaxID=147232 RepID=UPI003D9E95D7